MRRRTHELPPESDYAWNLPRFWGLGRTRWVATAVFEFIMGALRDNPRRIGKPLQEPLAPLYAARRGENRVIYRILEAQLVIATVSITHRRHAYHR